MNSFERKPTRRIYALSPENVSSENNNPNLYSDARATQVIPSLPKTSQSPSLSPEEKLQVFKAATNITAEAAEGAAKVLKEIAELLRAGNREAERTDITLAIQTLDSLPREELEQILNRLKDLRTEIQENIKNLISLLPPQ